MANTNSRKILREELKLNYVEKLTSFLSQTEDVLRVSSNEIAFPVVDKNGNEDFIVLTVKIPIGSRDGEAYDGYAMAESYELKCKLKKEKAKEMAEKKAKKIAKDKANRIKKE